MIIAVGVTERDLARWATSAFTVKSITACVLSDFTVFFKKKPEASKRTNTTDILLVSRREWRGNVLKIIEKEKRTFSK